MWETWLASSQKCAQSIPACWCFIQLCHLRRGIPSWYLEDTFGYLVTWKLLVSNFSVLYLLNMRGWTCWEAPMTFIQVHDVNHARYLQEGIAAYFSNEDARHAGCYLYLGCNWNFVQQCKLDLEVHLNLHNNAQFLHRQHHWHYPKIAASVGHWSSGWLAPLLGICHQSGDERMNWVLALKRHKWWPNNCYWPFTHPEAWW